MAELIFQAQGPTRKCVNITVIRDFLVEEDETFSFLISSDQTDEAVQVGTPSVSTVTILDEENGTVW